MIFTFAIKFDCEICHIRRYNGRNSEYAVTCKFKLTELHSRNPQDSQFSASNCYYLPQIELLGKTFDDPFVQDYMKSCPFPMINENNQPRFVANEADKTLTFSIEEVMALTMRKALREMYASASNELYVASTMPTTFSDLETKLKKYRIEPAVVVVVPNSFGEAQQRAIRVAADLAGMHVTHIVSQATSVAHFFKTAKMETAKMDKESRLSQDGNFLFFNFDGSTLDISVIKTNQKEKLIEIKLATGDSTLGGEVFMQRLMEQAPKELMEKGSWWFSPACFLLNHDEFAFVLPPRKSFYWLKRGTHVFTKSEVKDFKKYSDLGRSVPAEPWKMTSKQREEAYKLEKAELEKVSYRLTRQMYYEKCADLLERVKQLLLEAISEAGIAPSDYKSVQTYGEYCRLPGVLDIIREQLPDTLISFGDNSITDYVIENNVEYLGKSRERSAWKPCCYGSQLYEHDYDLIGAACLSFVSNRGGPFYYDRDGTLVQCIPHKNLRLINKSQVEHLVPNL